MKGDKGGGVSDWGYRFVMVEDHLCIMWDICVGRRGRLRR